MSSDSDSSVSRFLPGGGEGIDHLESTLRSRVRQTRWLMGFASAIVLLRLLFQLAEILHYPAHVTETQTLPTRILISFLLFAIVLAVWLWQVRLLSGVEQVVALVRTAERSRGDENLARSELKFQMLVHSVRDYAIIMLGSDGNVATWNEGAERLKGYTRDEIVGQHFSRFYPPEDIAAGKPETEIRVALADGRFEDEGWRLRKDGSRFWANVILTPLRDEHGKLTGFAKITRDFTARMQAEQEIGHLNADLERRNMELAAANAELEAFTYSVAHDLRAPVRHIYGFSKILVEDFANGLDAEGKSYLYDVMEDAERMGRLIDDLLSLARLSRQEPHVEITGLRRLVDEAVTSVKSDASGRDIQWSIGELPFVECDAGLMKQVYVNLLSNAVKYTRPRQPAIIEVGKKDNGGETVLFVRDNGVGFNMAYADKLFGVFQRLHRSEDFEGTGVGLATVKRIIDKHGGRIWAEADLDKGAMFCFTLGTVRPEEVAHG